MLIYGSALLNKMVTMMPYLKKPVSPEGYEAESWYIAFGTQVCSNDDPSMTFDLFTAVIFLS